MTSSMTSCGESEERGFPESQSAQRKAAHSLCVALPWFEEQLSKLQFWWVSSSLGCGGHAPLGDGEGAHRPLVATLTMATPPRALTESRLSDTPGVPGLLLEIGSVLCRWKQMVRLRGISRPYTRSSCGRLRLPSM